MVSRVADHAMANGLESTLQTASGKASYVKQMMTSGGTSKYWKKLFNPPPEDKLRETFGCHLQGSQGGRALVAGVMFCSDFAVCFSSDQPVGNSGGGGSDGYLRLTLPMQQVEVLQPFNGPGGETNQPARHAPWGLLLTLWCHLH
jgi:hypothetical protein